MVRMLRSPCLAQSPAENLHSATPPSSMPSIHPSTPAASLPRSPQPPPSSSHQQLGFLPTAVSTSASRSQCLTNVLHFDALDRASAKLPVAQTVPLVCRPSGRLQRRLVIVRFRDRHANHPRTNADILGRAPSACSVLLFCSCTPGLIFSSSLIAFVQTFPLSHQQPSPCP